MKVLNVGGGPVQLPPEYEGWDVDLLDIDPAVQPAICMDARDLGALEAGCYDAVYASHVLEHFAECDVGRVLAGFYHVLSDDGFADVRVPDARAVCLTVGQGDKDLDSILYRAPVGPIRIGDVLWGWQKQIAASGQDYYGHRWGFSRDMLGRALKAAGFEYVLIGSEHWELKALAYKQRPNDAE